MKLIYDWIVYHKIFNLVVTYYTCDKQLDTEGKYCEEKGPRIGAEKYVSNTSGWR